MTKSSSSGRFGVSEVSVDSLGRDKKSATKLSFPATMFHFKVVVSESIHPTPNQPSFHGFVSEFHKESLEGLLAGIESETSAPQVLIELPIAQTLARASCSGVP